MARQYRVLVTYLRNGVSVSQTLYDGPHRNHADRAFLNAGVLGRHGILSNCTVNFFDGFRIRKDMAQHFLNCACGKPVWGQYGEYARCKDCLDAQGVQAEIAGGVQ